MKEADLQRLLDESVHTEHHVLLIDQSSAELCNPLCIWIVIAFFEIPGKYHARVAGMCHDSTCNEACCQAGMAGDYSLKACQDGWMQIQMPAI